MLMREAGLTGMGGAGFPTYRKYETDRGIRSLLINGGECEPYLTCDDRLMVFEAGKIVTGAAALARSVTPPSGEPPQLLFCVENDKPLAIARLKEALRALSGEIRAQVVSLSHRYPQGGGASSSRRCWASSWRRESCPLKPVLVSNVATAAAMADALQGRPLTHRIVTVSGKVARPAITGYR